ncbi:MAG: hypothetical protein RR255_00115 [Bacilli bacterium]
MLKNCVCIAQKKNNMGCYKCEHVEYCKDFANKMRDLTEDISPCGLLSLTNNLTKIELKKIKGE